MDGGHRELDVVLDPVGSDLVQRKHIGGVKYEDITMQVGSGMSKAFYNWMKDSFDKGVVRKNGAIIAADFDYKEKSKRAMSQAFITEVKIPALDVASKEHCYVAVSVSPTKLTPVVPPSGQPVLGAKQKAWLCSNFVFQVDGVDTSRVAKIDSFTWKCSIMPDGSQVLDVSDISVSFPKASVSSWREWYQSLASGADDERDGSLTIVGADNGAVVTIGLGNLGLYRLGPDPASPAKRFNVELYCEKMKWDIKKQDKV